VKVTVTGAFVVLVKLPVILFPVPFGIPVTEVVLSLVQLKVDDGTFPESAMLVIAFPEQIVCAELVATAVGVGFTITVAVIGDPVQEFAVGVIVKVTITGAVVVLVKIPVIFPLPLAAIPVTEGLFLVQLKAVVATLPESTMPAIALPEQIV
tara:strand:- start:73 stop:528 length:456 start_codon:yes stop_codon:yes gene_type:complete